MSQIRKPRSEQVLCSTHFTSVEFGSEVPVFENGCNALRPSPARSTLRLLALGHANGRAPRELLGNKPPSIQAALTSDAFFAHHDGFRQSSKRESWKDLVNEASRRPKSLGFIEFEDGLPGLGRIVGRPPTTIWRHLNTWAQTGGRRPLVVVDELKEPGLNRAT